MRARSFVIGDIHGGSEPLRKLLGEVRALARPGDRLVFLGDYIDRGPASRQAVEMVLAEPKRWPGEVVCLRGNHEAVLLGLLERRDPLGWAQWLYGFGGWACAQSYGVADPLSIDPFVSAFPDSHRRFLAGLRPWFEDENGIYLHAGVPHGRHPRELRSVEALYWTESNGIEYRLGKPVVYGHTPQRERRPGEAARWRPFVRPDRIGIDTGCGFQGPLTAVVLPERQFFSAWE
jgi:serine/threonine protein phosphatase 1